MTPNGAVVAGAASAGGHGVRMSFAGSHPRVAARGRDALPGRVHYFRGSDPHGWRGNVPTYASVQVDQVYPGIDLVYYGSRNHLEFDFIVAPGADPNAIRLVFDGAERLRVDAGGDLVFAIGPDEVRLAKPLIYQEVDGARRAIAGGYELLAANQVGFEMETYDRRAPLILDPVLIYSTYLGGSGEDRGAAVAVGGDGYAYLAGTTDSPNFLGRSTDDTQDAFLVKLDPAGVPIYTAYLGGSGREQVAGVAVDAAGSAYVMGTTHSRDFPAVSAAQTVLRGDDDVFVAKLDPTGGRLVYSTYLGGSDEDGGLGLTIDAAGSAYVTGYTYSRDFPAVNAVQPEFGGERTDAFVAKLAGDGSAIVYGTYLGGDRDDHGRGVAVDALGAACVVGSTTSTHFTAAAPGEQTLAGVSDAFLVKLQPAGSAIAWSMLLGGCDEEHGFAVAADTSGNAYVAGLTASADFPVADAFQAALRGGADAFVAKVGAGGTLLFSTYLGGSGDESRPSLAVDGAGRVYVAGATQSLDFPTLSSVQAGFGGGKDMFLARIQASGSALDYSTYLGGSAVEEAWACTVDREGNAYVIGRTRSADFPTVNAAQPSPGGRADAVIVKLSP